MVDYLVESRKVCSDPFQLQNGFKAKKRIPYISPSEDFTKNVIKLFDKGMIS